MSPPNLAELLVLCAAADSRPSGICIDYIERLRVAHATVLLGTCMTDVSLTRCVQAERGYLYLQQHEAIRYVLWLDHDMATSIECTLALIECCELANNLHPCSVTGAYVNRHRRKRPELAAMALAKHKPIAVQLVESCRANYMLIPTLAGLGCLLQPRSVFMAHCDESRHFAYPDLDQLVPEVTSSRTIHASELAQYVDVDPQLDRYFWNGEDFEYSMRELEALRMVYLAPIDFAHESTTVMVPGDGVVFPGLMAQPEPDTE